MHKEKHKEKKSAMDGFLNLYKLGKVYPEAFFQVHFFLIPRIPDFWNTRNLEFIAR